MKKLIAAAVAVAVIAPAMAIASGPTLYGKIHTSVDLQDNGGSGSANNKYDEWGMHSNSSRIGVKGSEDLGNGMKVGYLIEWGVNMTGNGGGLSDRNRAITLSGDWGTALAGRWDTPYKSTGRKLDLFGDRTGDTRALSNVAGTTEQRADNVLAYVTPNMNGFSATVAYVFDAGTCNAAGGNTAACSDDNSDADAWSFNAIYNNGPLLAVLGYVNYSDGDADGSTPTENSTAWRVGGSYAFGDFKVLASYTDMNDQGLTKNNDPDMWTLGGSYKMGNNTIKLQYSDRDDSGLKTCDNAGGAGVLSCKDDAEMWTIGLDHTMSKRTTVYVQYTDVDNGNDTNETPWNANGHGGTASGVDGKNASAFSVGIIHKF